MNSWPNVLRLSRARGYLHLTESEYGFLLALFRDSLCPPYDGVEDGGTTFNRSAVVAAVPEQGETVWAASKRFGVSVASAVRIGQRQRAFSGQAPGKIGGHRRPVLAGEFGEWLLARLAEKPDLTMRALTAELAARSVRVAHDTVWRFVRAAGPTIKKRP